MSNPEPPSRENTAGRGQGHGQWLEYQLARALGRWGYETDRNVYVFSQEVDVVAVRGEKEGKPTDWLLAQCKDWETTRINTEVIYRLCLMAFSCRAMPVLCHTSELTADARRLARHWEVRVLTLNDLHRGSLPTPNIAEPTAEYGTYETQYTAREERGSLPVLFMGEPRKQFSYVPGFRPDGRSHEYRPLDDTDHSDGSGGG